tara:strand:+ start:423 stop:827 length:405 start_codon:yes stop_codon:yes gene_type:complete
VFYIRRRSTSTSTSITARATTLSSFFTSEAHALGKYVTQSARALRVSFGILRGERRGRRIKNGFRATIVVDCDVFALCLARKHHLEWVVWEKKEAAVNDFTTDNKKERRCAQNVRSTSLGRRAEETTSHERGDD